MVNPVTLGRSNAVGIYHRLKATGYFSRLEDLVQADVAQHGPVTQSETWNRLRIAGQVGVRVKKDSISPRFSEMARAGVIGKVGVRTCTFSGEDGVEVWDLTGTVPVTKPCKTSVTKVQLERDACLAIARQVEAEAQTPEGRRAAREIADRIIARGKA